MTDLSVSRYTADQDSDWDDFVRRSRNGSFLFLRDYMDYMRDRIVDCSLIVRDADRRIVAVLPGHLDEDQTYRSHGQLTYGGLISGPSARMATVLSALDGCFTWLAQTGVTSVYYKPVPHIYHTLFAEEDRYALFLLRAECI